MSVRVTSKATAEGKRLEKAMEELDKLAVFVGFQAGESAGEGGVDVAEYALYNELGTSRGIPSRPFIRDSVDKHSDEINKFLERAVAKILDGASVETVLSMIGAEQVKRIQSEILDGNFAPNAEATIRRKGSDHPLIDTGRMMQSVHYKTGEKGEFE